jgi:septal ring factor EnvC (AmiA/AmiB activator)
MVPGLKLRSWSFIAALTIFAAAGAPAQEDIDPALGDPETGIVPQEEVPPAILPAEEDEPGAIPQPADSQSTVGEMAREAAELERIRADLQKARAEREAKAKQETKILSTLNHLDAELSLKQRLLSGLERKESRLDADLQATRAELDRARMKLDERRNILRARLRNIYKMGEKPGLQVLLGATSAVDLMRRFDWLLLVANQDKRLFEDVQESVIAVREAEEELSLKVAEVREIRDESEREKTDLLKNRETRSALLESIRGEKMRSQKIVTELEQAEKEIKRILAELSRRSKGPSLPDLPAGAPFASARGKLPWPVHGKVARWFGVQKDKRFGTSTFNGGVDIKAERDADVIAVHRGRADYVDWLPGYGQCIILSHGDGYYTLYAHTARVFVSPGDLIEAGDVIATVGDTGSLLGDVLHFEIRKDAEPVNPAPWLRSQRLDD